MDLCHYDTTHLILLFIKGSQVCDMPEILLRAYLVKKEISDR